MDFSFQGAKCTQSYGVVLDSRFPWLTRGGLRKPLSLAAYLFDYRAMQPCLR